MWYWFKQILTPPTFEDEETTRIAALLHTLLLVLFVVIGVVTPIVLVADPENVGLNLLIALPVMLVIVGLLVLLRYARVKMAGGLLLAVLFVSVTANIWFFEGGIRGVNTGGYFLVIIIAALLLGGRAAILFGGLSILASLGFYYAETNGVIASLPREVGLADWFLLSLTLIIVAVLLRFGVQSTTLALRRAHANAQQVAIFRALAENAADGILMSTPQGQITYVNRAGYELFGRDYEQQEMLGRNFATLVPAAGLDVNHTTLLDTLQAGSWRGELTQQRPDGTNVDLYSTAFAIHDEQTEEVIALAAIVRDVTGQKQAEVERERLQQEVIEAQQRTLKELSTPVIPVMEGVLVMPLIGSIDTMRARDITRALLAGITRHRARVVILDITGVPLIDSGVAGHLNKTIQAAQLKGARLIITGMSDAVAETVVDLGIDWSGIETLSDLQTGLRAVLADLKSGR